MLGTKSLLILALAVYVNVAGGTPTTETSNNDNSHLRIKRSTATELIECPSQFGTYGLLGEDCNQYVACHDGTATVMTCPTGLAFDENISSCNWRESVACDQYVTSAPVATPAPTLAPLAYIPLPVPAPSDFIPQYNEICPNPSGTYPVHSEDCSKYKVCHKGRAMVLNCAPGLSFDPIKSSCDLAQNVVCKSCETTAPLETPAPNPSPAFALIPAPAPVIVAHPAPPAVIPQHNEICPKQYGTFPVSGQDCSKYKVCHRGRATVLNCAPGLAFDPIKCSCGSAPAPAPVHIPAPAPVYIPAPAPVYIPAPAPVTRDPNTVVAPHIKFTCPSRYGTFACPNEYNKYMSCNDWKSTVTSCSPGLSYNPNKRSCDW